jgi:hypothetical protein
VVLKLPNNFDLLSFARELVESCSGADSKESRLPLLARIRLPKMTFLSVLYDPRLSRRRVRSLLSHLPAELSRRAGAAKSLLREDAWDRLFEAAAMDEERDDEKLESTFWEAVPDDDGKRDRHRSSSRRRSRSRSRDRERRSSSPSRRASNSRSRSRSPRRSDSSRHSDRRSRSRSRDRKRHHRSRSRSPRSSHKGHSERNSSTSDGQASSAPAPASSASSGQP